MDRWARRVRVWGAAPPGPPVPGEDLILHSQFADTTRFPAGTLLDDWLEPADRAELDRLSNSALVRWREETDAALETDGIPLGRLFEGELHADVFLRERFALAGLERAFASSPPEAVELRLADRDLHTAAAALLASHDIRAELAEEASAPTYPLAFASSIGRRRPLAAAARELLGAPAVVRGDVLMLPAPALMPLWDGLLRSGARPVVDLFNRPPGGSLRTGGWIAHPGRRLRRMAGRMVARALDGLEQPDTPEGDPLAWLERRRALRLLGTRAPEVVASELAFRRTLSRGGLRAIVLPSDATAHGRAIIAAGRREGVPVTHVQHGFFSDLWKLDGRPAPYVDGLAADRAAVWSAAHAERIQPHAAGRVVVTGNPAAHLTSPVGERSGGFALVLIQPPGMGTPAISPRAPAEFTAAALAGIAEALPGVTAVLRPHPLDRGDPSEIAAASAVRDWRIAGQEPFYDLLAGAAACVGPASTATLQALAAGVPTVHLDVTDAQMASPFDLSGVIPAARSADALASALSSPRTDPPEPALEALGARPDALERVLDLVLDRS